MDPNDRAAGLVELARGQGYAVRLDGHGGLTLERQHPEAEMPAELLAELKAARDVILAHLATECELCGRTWWVPEDEIRLAVRHPWACDRGGQSGKDKETVAACPFREAGR